MAPPPGSTRAARVGGITAPAQGSGGAAGGTGAIGGGVIIGAPGVTQGRVAPGGGGAAAAGSLIG